jgi:hypothetical protein
MVLRGSGATDHVGEKALQSPAATKRGGRKNLTRGKQSKNAPLAERRPIWAAALAPASQPSPAQGHRVVALESEVRSLRRALYVSVAVIALLLLELAFAVSKLL